MKGKLVPEDEEAGEERDLSAKITWMCIPLGAARNKAGEKGMKRRLRSRNEKSWGRTQNAHRQFSPHSGSRKQMQ